jgi:hypothetical protein
MKKSFIFGCGVSFCGTTSLHRTLTVNNNYLHTGFLKEGIYLPYIFNSKGGTIDPFTLSNFHYPLELKNKNNDVSKLCYTNKKFATDVYNTSDYLSVICKFSLEEVNEIFSYPYTLEKFLKYRRLLSQYSEGIFDAIGDFTNYNFNTITLYQDQFEFCKSELEKNFNIKFLIILRDPIRAYFSFLNAALYSNSTFLKSVFDSKNFDNVTDFIIDKTISNKKLTLINTHNYAKFINYVKKKYGKENIHYIIMEDFFNNNNKIEKFKLEKFLDKKLTSIHPCVFVPDQGINPPKNGIYKFLSDQWDADKEILRPELYVFLKKHYQYLYDEFEELHGSLPADWGRPIDYGY